MSDAMIHSESYVYEKPWSGKSYIYEQPDGTDVISVHDGEEIRTAKETEVIDWEQKTANETSELDLHTSSTEIDGLEGADKLAQPELRSRKPIRKKLFGGFKSAHQMVQSSGIAYQFPSSPASGHVDCDCDACLDAQCERSGLGNEQRSRMVEIPFNVIIRKNVAIKLPPVGPELSDKANDADRDSTLHSMGTWSNEMSDRAKLKDSRNMKRLIKQWTSKPWVRNALIGTAVVGCVAAVATVVMVVRRVK